MPPLSRHLVSLTLLLLAASPGCAARQQSADPTPQPTAAEAAPDGALPRTHVPRPTSPAISAADLMTRLYIFADDSMMGRQAGTEYNVKATNYLAAELRKLRLTPAGDSGTFFQSIPLVRRSFVERSRLTVNGEPLALWTDVAPVPRRGTLRSIDGAQAVYGGVYGDTTSGLTRQQLAGKLVVLLPPPGANAQAAGRRLPPDSPLTDAAGVAVVGLEQLPAQLVELFRQPALAMSATSASAAPAAPLALAITRRTAERLLGAPLGGLRVGSLGRRVSGTVALGEVSAGARNVVAVLPGSDPALRGQYVAIGAHNDHIGFNGTPVDHDSTRAHNSASWAMRVKSAVGRAAATATQPAAIVVNVDSLRRLSPPRRDSIANGADDDGSGSVAVLEIAEALARAPQKPRRSVLFVWHTAEELGLLGSRYFTDNPTVPRDSIVAQINMDMIGRGAAAEMPGGGPYYLGLVGSRRLSTELGDLVEAVNREQRRPLELDYQLDADGHPENIYCRSDHYNYARYGIPIVFFFTGLHGDYHRVTDEPQYIDYPHMERITRFIAELTTRVANLDHRPVVDKPRPDPRAPCRQ